MGRKRLDQIKSATLNPHFSNNHKKKKKRLGFKMKGRAITHCDDEGEDADLFSIVGSESKSKNKYLKRKHSSTTTKSTSGSPAVHKKAQPIEIIDLGGDNNESNVAEDERVRLEIVRLAKRSTSSSTSAPKAASIPPRLSHDTEIILLDGDDDKVDTSAIDKEYLAAMQRIQSITKVSREMDRTTASAAYSSINPQPSSSSVMSRSFIVPQVLTAEQRRREAEETYARELALIAKSQPIEILSSKKTEEESDNDEDADLQVKTRLSNDERKWKVFSNKPIAKVTY